ncbi:hypothetical protein LLE49_25930 [Alicyclobacillus tolerans]|uniref:hypothetical protein n=1 Tax=Alicyclobacillus tolerans TaxID=90970 RepID=UPI001F464FEE|nr:hypothetical protein [Alicyclobacillus tolerans]MCF8568169.1 hypothetical protein [Alicyclobacillus tolerans]
MPRKLKYVLSAINVSTTRAPGGWWLAEATVDLGFEDETVPKRVVETAPNRRTATNRVARRIRKSGVLCQAIYLDHKPFRRLW